jgi:hypothetical protein
MDRFDSIDLDQDEEVALAVGAGGLALLTLGMIAGSRALRLLGLASAATGAVLFVRHKLEVRSEKIAEAEDKIRSELDDLDPVARAQVLADIARSGLSGSGSNG